jgi:AcrR family transcriptional regulator
MARIVKEEEYAARRMEILDVAHRLVYTKGFEQMTIQDILNELQISKGAFYHYFSSKSVLLEALIQRTLDGAEQIMIPVVEDPDLPALEKLQQFFTTLSRWKTAQKAYLLKLLNVWYADENAIVRQKMLTATIRRISPLFTRAIRQGIQEGVLTTTYPDQSGQVLLTILQGFGETLAERLILNEPQPGDFKQVEDTAAAYNDAIARVLGATPGILKIVDVEYLAEWFAAPVNSP